MPLTNKSNAEAEFKEAGHSADESSKTGKPASSKQEPQLDSNSQIPLAAAQLAADSLAESSQADSLSEDEVSARGRAQGSQLKVSSPRSR